LPRVWKLVALVKAGRMGFDRSRPFPKSNFNAIHSILVMPKTLSKQLNSLFWLFFLFSCGCEQKWDPDNQFQLEVQNLKAQREVYKLNRIQEAQRNLSKTKGELLLNVVRKLPIRELDLLLGYKYKILAQTTQQGDFWERRQYYWEDIVEGKWGSTSQEYEICAKKTVFMIVSINSNEVIGVEY